MRNFFFLLIVALSLTACKKALDVENDLRFVQVNWIDSYEDNYVGERLTGPMRLELRTDGRGFLYPGSGDIVWEGTYKISFKKLKIHITSIDKTYVFDVKSEQELTGPDGEILRIKQD